MRLLGPDSNRCRRIYYRLCIRMPRLWVLVCGGARPSQNALLGRALTLHTGKGSQTFGPRERVFSVIGQTCSLPYPIGRLPTRGEAYGFSPLGKIFHIFPWWFTS